MRLHRRISAPRIRPKYGVMEPQATHGLPSLAQGFLPCGQTAIRLFLA
jgi:hypothetical protein